MQAGEVKSCVSVKSYLRSVTDEKKIELKKLQRELYAGGEDERIRGMRLQVGYWTSLRERHPMRMGARQGRSRGRGCMEGYMRQIWAQ